jgi:hypothetical protein
MDTGHLPSSKLKASNLVVYPKFSPDYLKNTVTTIKDTITTQSHIWKEIRSMLTSTLFANDPLLEQIAIDANGQRISTTQNP